MSESADTVNRNLFRELESRGMKGCIVNPDNAPEGFRGALSFVISALRDPQIRFHFEWKGKRCPAVVRSIRKRPEMVACFSSY
jgi:hypothetical protein